jgi:hypothetical protein
VQHNLPRTHPVERVMCAQQERLPQAFAIEVIVDANGDLARRLCEVIRYGL